MSVKEHNAIVIMCPFIIDDADVYTTGVGKNTCHVFVRYVGIQTVQL